MKKIYKVTGNGGKSCHGGNYTWVPGEWSPMIEDIVPCESGYHFCMPEHLVYWLDDEIWTAEVRGYVEEVEDKIVAQQGMVIERLDTWNKRTQLLFSADCAEHVLHNFENAYPNDDRPRKAIEAKRLFANGEISENELRTALSAARYAAWSSAWSSAESAKSARSARSAWSAAGSAEREWQTERLFWYLDEVDND